MYMYLIRVTFCAHVTVGYHLCLCLYYVSSYSYILELVGVLVGLKEVVLRFKERGRLLYTVCVGKD